MIDYKAEDVGYIVLMFRIVHVRYTIINKSSNHHNNINNVQRTLENTEHFTYIWLEKCEIEVITRE